MLARKGSERPAQKYQGQNGKEGTKEEPADEEFFGTVGISSKAKKQNNESQNVKSHQESAKKVLVNHKVKYKRGCEDKKRRTAR